MSVFSILTWPFNTWVAKYTDRCLNSDMVNPWGSKMDQIFQVKSTSSACMHARTQLRRSPLPCAPSTLGPRQLFFLCWPGSAYGPGLGWRASGGALFLSFQALWHTHKDTNTLTYTQYNVILSPRSKTGHSVTHVSEWRLLGDSVVGLLFSVYSVLHLAVKVHNSHRLAQLLSRSDCSYVCW